MQNVAFLSSGLNLWIALAFVMLIALGALWYFQPLRRQQRQEHVELPAGWKGILAQNFLFYDWLPDSAFSELTDLIPRFLSEKRFEGCHGLVVTEEMRITIAAHACLLLAGHRQPFFPQLDNILIYPESFVAPAHVDVGSGQDVTMAEARSGESWQSGLVIIAWAEFQEDLTEALDRNVLIHEFAHQLDQGISASAAIRNNYAHLCRDLKSRKKVVLDDYAAENEHEFFAVATETFFLNPQDLQTKSPDLYETLKQFYGLDPAAWGMPRLQQ